MTGATAPVMVSQMSTSLVSAASQANLDVWQQTITFGYVVIDSLYRPHPIKRPFELLRRRRARHWWEAEVRRTGQQLAANMAQAFLRTVTEQANRPADQANARFHQQNYERMREFDIGQQIRLAKQTAKANAKAGMRVADHQATLNPILDPNAILDTAFARIAAVEKDPSLTPEEKQRRLEIIRLTFNLPPNGRH